MFIKYLIKLKRSASSNEPSNTIKITETLQRIYNRAFSILISKNENNDCLILPGCHELLESLGECHCVLMRDHIDVYNLQEILSLFESKTEYEMSFIKGLTRFFKIEKVPESFCMTVFESFQSNILKPIIQWECIQNRLHLKTVKKRSNFIKFK
jgi:hypothetical protein